MNDSTLKNNKMKKTIILLILSFVLVVHQYSMTIISTTTVNKDIPLLKDPIRPQPRTPSLEFFTASFNNQILSIAAYAYTGNVQVQIIGINGFSFSYYCNSTDTQYIDISTLSEGTYLLSITTDSGFIYTGEFEL